MNLKDHLGTLARLAITIVGLALAAVQIDFERLWIELTQANWWWIFGGFMLVNLSMVLRAYRWQILLAGTGASDLRFSRLVELYFVGNFFNAFLPSGFGGDVVRAVEATRDTPADVASGTVFLDRLTGLMVLFFLGLLALPFRPDAFPDWLALMIAIFSIVGLTSGFLFIDGRLLAWVGRLPLAGRLPRAISPVGDGPIAKFLAAVNSCGWPAIWGAIGVSTLFSLLLAGWWTMATYAVGEPVSYFYNLLVVPIFGVALLVPTIGGLGVREMIAPILFQGASLSGATAVSVSLLVFIMLRLSGLLGAPLYLFAIWRDQRSVSSPAP